MASKYGLYYIRAAPDQDIDSDILKLDSSDLAIAAVTHIYSFLSEHGADQSKFPDEIEIVLNNDNKDGPEHQWKSSAFLSTDILLGIQSATRSGKRPAPSDVLFLNNPLKVILKGVELGWLQVICYDVKSQTVVECLKNKRKPMSPMTVPSPTPMS